MLLYASALFIAATSAGDDAAASSTTQVQEKKICRREVATGSVMAKMTCRTKAEWSQLAEQARKDLDRTRDMERSRSIVGTYRN